MDFKATVVNEEIKIETSSYSKKKEQNCSQ